MQRMKNLLRCFIACLLTFHCIASAEEKSTALQWKPLLWRIEAPKPSYVFGTMHLRNPAVAMIHIDVHDAIAASDVVLTEIPLGAASHTATGNGLWLPNGGRLEALLQPDLYHELEAEYERILPGRGPKMLSHMQANAATRMLGRLEDWLKFPDRATLDELVAARAETLGKKTGGLETIADREALDRAFTPAEQITMLRESLRRRQDDRKADRDRMQEFIRAYYCGELPALVPSGKGHVQSGDNGLSEKYERLVVTERNTLMAGRALEMMKAEPEKGFFFAVGAAHLPGETGMLKSFETAGYKLTRVETPEAK
jgi:uncharacterized protein YbaP (TraB family)